MRVRAVWISALLAVLLAASPAVAKPQDPPDATQVVARRQHRLADALRVAMARAVDVPDKPRAIALILDPTPTLKRWDGYLQRALEAADLAVPTAPHWVVAPLGGRFGKAAASAKDLGKQIPRVLAETPDISDTLGALRKTIGSLKKSGSVVVYLADQHFEDEHDLEKLVKTLRSRRCVFSVIGPEAAFSTGWNDGIKNARERTGDVLDPMYPYWPQVTRSPFGESTSEAPKRCGDTAFPLIPFRFSVYYWSAHFSENDRSLADYGSKPKPSADKNEKAPRGNLDDPEALRKKREEILKDLEERLKGGKPKPKAQPADRDAPAGVAPKDGVTRRDAPVPSGFGPYALMRAAGVTGGRYVLFTWNRLKGGTPYELDYGRCNLYPPDLRSRKKLLRALSKDALTRACMNAWDQLTSVYGDHLVRVTPPLRGKRLAPAEINEVEPLHFKRWDIFDTPAERDEYVEISRRLQSDLDKMRRSVRKHIPKELAKVDGPVRRRAAEAELFAHLLDIAHLRVSDEIALAKAIPKSAWKGKSKPMVSQRKWLRPGRDPEGIRRDKDPYPAEEAHALVEERARLLRRYAGTPVGEQLALNSVYMAKPKGYTPSNEPIRLPKTGREQPGSKGPSAPQGGPGSGGSSPSTGGG